MKHNYDSLGSTTAQPQASKEAYLANLVKRFLFLVEEQEAKFMNQFGDNNRLCEGDMASAGYEALLEAAQSFDPTCGLPFEPYARKAIKNAMQNELRELFPVDLKTTWNKDGFVYGDTFNSCGIDELPSRWCCNWDDDECYLKELLADAISRLSTSERTLIEARYGYDGEQMRLVDLGNLLNVSHQAIDKKLHRILQKLRDFISDDYHPYRCCA